MIDDTTGKQRKTLLTSATLYADDALNHLKPRGELIPVVDAHELSEIRPLDFIKFAERMNWAVPAEFRQALIGIKANKKQQSKTEPQSHDDEHLNCLLKLIFVMAVDGYEYDPSKPRNWATGDKRGISILISGIVNQKIDNDTVKNCLNKAETLLNLSTKNPRKPRQQKMLALMIGMTMNRYNNLAKPNDTRQKLLLAITRVNEKLKLNIDIDSDVIDELLTEAKRELHQQTP